MAAGFKTGGRKAGTPNRSTAKVREAIAVFANGNVDRLQEWLDRIAEDDPAKAADLFLRLLEYHVPKLARTEIAGDPENPIGILPFEFVDPQAAEED